MHTYGTVNSIFAEIQPSSMKTEGRTDNAKPISFCLRADHVLLVYDFFFLSFFKLLTKIIVPAIPVSFSIKRSNETKINGPIASQIIML